MEENFRIAIVGGKGKMGGFFARFFEGQGYEVIVKDVDVGPSYEELCRQAKVLLLSVPLDVFPKVVEEMAPFVTDENWVFDVCSLKVSPVNVMRKFLKRGEVLATHPLFGPYEESLQHRIIAYYPIRGKGLLSWFKKTFTKAGSKLVYVAPSEHDKLMGLVQVTNHFFLILFGNLLAESNVSLPKLVELSTPSFAGQLQVLSRLAWQDENLYARIQLDNPYGEGFRRLFLKSCRDLVRALRNQKEAERVFKEKFLKAKKIAKDLLTLLPKT